MAHRMATISMTLSDLQGHSHIASLFRLIVHIAVQRLMRLQLT